MQEMADCLMTGFKHALSVHIGTELGTDLTLDLTGRPMVSDLKAVPGTGANLPCGEVYCCPVENGASGVLVIDGCFGSHGIVESPVTLTLKDGRVTDVQGDDPDSVDPIKNLMNTDEGSATSAELGIGLNSGARLTDNMLEAEKALRTAHIAFGTNQGMPGGQNKSSIHIDYLFNQPTITVTGADDRERVIMRNGEVV
jgi:aminopeptidase